MIPDPVVDRPDFQATILFVHYCNGSSCLPLSRTAYSNHNKPNNAYHLPAKHHHRITMESFIGGALDFFGLTLMRIPPLDLEL